MRPISGDSRRKGNIHFGIMDALHTAEVNNASSPTTNYLCAFNVVNMAHRYGPNSTYLPMCA